MSGGTPESSRKLKIVGAPVLVAPATNDTNEANTIVLFPLNLEFLSIQVLFHGIGVPELKVRFSTADGEELASDLTTDAKGLVRLKRRVPAGNYLCELEEQEPVNVSTARSPERTFPVILPVSRPYTDLRECVEFVGMDRTASRGGGR